MTVKIITLIQVTDAQTGIRLEIDDTNMADLAESGIAQVLLSKFAGEARTLARVLNGDMSEEINYGSKN